MPTCSHTVCREFEVMIAKSDFITQQLIIFACHFSKVKAPIPDPVPNFHNVPTAPIFLVRMYSIRTSRRNWRQGQEWVSFHRTDKVNSSPCSGSTMISLHMTSASQSKEKNKIRSVDYSKLPYNFPQGPFQQ